MGSFMKEFEHLKIKLEEIKSATGNFDITKVIGRGGFGDVYEGELCNSKGQTKVAIKRLDRRHGQGDGEFWKEIMMLSRYTHKNLISLLGYCDEGGEKILVYEYACNGSLDRHLNDPTLTWTQRIKICLDAAHGLSYLHDHKGTQQRVLHRDIKSSNILLDDKWNAKVSDMGLSKLGPANQEHTALVTGIAGTFGYIDPMYLQMGILTKESDVYAFGVVLFEVLCGRLCTDNGKFPCLVNTWKQSYEQKKLDEIIFQDLVQPMDMTCLEIFSDIAFQCLHEYREERPTMPLVAGKLESALKVHENRFVKEPEEYQDTLQAAVDPVNRSRVEKLDHPLPKRRNTLTGFMMEFQHLEIELEEIKKATNNFDKNKIIEANEFGEMYKGEVSHSKGRSMAAIKRLDRKLGLGDDEFYKEVDILSSYTHQNLISLLGFYHENDEKIVVYEYAYHGSLNKHLNDKNLTWTQRIKICLDAARGLSCLHNSKGTQKRVLHRDIKSFIILLDDKWNAKVSGMTKSILVTDNQEQTDNVTESLGTIGYCDPLFMETYTLTIESDIYSFGVVLFEVFCGRLCFKYIHGRSKILVPKWKQAYEENKLEQIIFQGPMQPMDPTSLKTFSGIAFQCLHKSREERPTISLVVEKLEIALQFQEQRDLKTPDVATVLPPN